MDNSHPLENLLEPLHKGGGGELGERGVCKGPIITGREGM
jgi:hypothetical protein